MKKLIALTNGTDWKKGSVNIASILNLLYRLLQTQEMGVLKITGQNRKLEVLIRDGLIIELNSNYIREDSLGRYLIRLSKITPKENAASFSRAQKEGCLQGNILVDMKVLSEEELTEHLTNHKRDKFLRLFQGTWHDSRYQFDRCSIANIRTAMEPLPLRKVIKVGILKIAPKRDIYGMFERNDITGTPIMLEPAFFEMGKILAMPGELVKLAKRIDGHCLHELRQAFPKSFGRYLRLVFLLVVTGAAIPLYKSGQKEAEGKMIEEPRPVKPLVQPVVEQNPQAKALVQARGFFEHGAYLEARNLLKQILASNPNGSEPLALCAWCQFQLRGKTDDAVAQECIEMLLRAIRSDDKNEWAHYFFGKILQFTNRKREAASHFEKAHRINPSNKDFEREVRLLKIQGRKSDIFQYR